MSTSPKPQEKSSEILESAVSSEDMESEAVKQQEQRKSSSSIEPNKKENLPQPPPKPKGRSLLTTDGGEDVALLDNVEDDDDEEIDMLEKIDMKPEKPRMSFSLRFGRSKKKDKSKNKAAPGRGSFIGFFMPKNANKAFNSMNDLDNDTSRGDSVAWRRKESKEMTKSLQLDMDIYTYLKERSPSFEDIPEVEQEPVKVPPQPNKPPIVKKRSRNKAKQKKAPGTTSSLLVTTGGPKEGMTRQATRTADLELADRKKRGFFRRFNPFRRRKRDGGRRMGFASRVITSFRASFRGTQADDIRQLLDEKEAKSEKKAEEEGLFRKDSDLTDLSGDSGIDSSLLVNDKIEAKLPDDVQIDDEEAHKSRQSKIFDDDEEEVEKPKKKKESFLGADVTKASDDLPLIKAKGDRESDAKIEAEKKATKVEKAFTLNSPKQNSPNVKVVNTGARKTSDLEIEGQ